MTAAATPQCVNRLVTACHALVLVDIGGDELEAAFLWSRSHLTPKCTLKRRLYLVSLKIQTR